MSGFGFGFAAGAVADESRKLHEQARADQEFKLRQNQLLMQLEGQREQNDISNANLGLEQNKFGNVLSRQALGDETYAGMMSRPDLVPELKDMATHNWRLGGNVQSPQQVTDPRLLHTRALEVQTANDAASERNTAANNAAAAARQQAQIASNERIARAQAGAAGGAGGRINANTAMAAAIRAYSDMADNGSTPLVIDAETGLERPEELEEFVQRYMQGIGAGAVALPGANNPAPPQPNPNETVYERLVREANARKAAGQGNTPARPTGRLVR